MACGLTAPYSPPKTQTELSNVAGDLGLLPTTDMYFKAIVWSLCEALPVILVSFNDTLRDSMRVKLHASSLVQELDDVIQLLHDQGVRADDLSTRYIITGLSIPSVHILEGHDASAPWPRHLQETLQKLTSGARLDPFIGILDMLPEAGRPPGGYDPYRGGGGMRPGVGAPLRLLCGPE